MPESEFERFIRDPENRRLYEQERLLGEATELIAQVMQGEAPWQTKRTGGEWIDLPGGGRGRVIGRTHGSLEEERNVLPGVSRVRENEDVYVQEKKWAVKKAELAERLGKSRAYVTQVLGGSRNMTLRTLADFAFALGFRVELRAVPLEGEKP